MAGYRRVAREAPAPGRLGLCYPYRMRSSRRSDDFGRRRSSRAVPATRKIRDATWEPALEAVRRLWIVGLSLAWLGCVPVTVSTQQTAPVRLDRIETFALLAPPASVSADALYDAEMGEKIRDEIAAQLEAKGYREVSREEADVTVAFEIRDAEQRMLGDAGDPDSNFMVVKRFVEGRLDVLVYDQRLAESVWRGTAETRIDGGMIDARKARMQSVRAILAEFPEASAPAVAAPPAEE